LPPAEKFIGAQLKFQANFFLFFYSKRLTLISQNTLSGEKTMKKTILFAICSILLFASAATAQDDMSRYSSPRLETLVNQLKRHTVDLVDRTSEDLNRNQSNSRADIEAAFLAQQLDASAGLFSQMIRDGRRAAELRDGAAILNDLARRGPVSGYNNILWRDAQRTISDISRELGGTGGYGGGNNGGGNNNPPPAQGRAFWRGTVDKEVHLVLQRRSLETRTVDGATYNNVNFSFTSSLPTRNVTVEVLKKKGRGTVRVLEQPNRDNDYTAVVQILDDAGGAKEYELEITWR
jgi:hypothetical protein